MKINRWDWAQIPCILVFQYVLVTNGITPSTWDWWIVVAAFVLSGLLERESKELEMGKKEQK